MYRVVEDADQNPYAAYALCKVFEDDAHNPNESIEFLKMMIKIPMTLNSFEDGDQKLDEFIGVCVCLCIGLALGIMAYEVDGSFNATT